MKKPTIETLQKQINDRASATARQEWTDFQNLVFDWFGKHPSEGLTIEETDRGGKLRAFGFQSAHDKDFEQAFNGIADEWMIARAAALAEARTADLLAKLDLLP